MSGSYGGLNGSVFGETGHTTRADRGMPLTKKEALAIDRARLETQALEQDAKYGVTTFKAPHGYSALVAEVPAYVITVETPKQRQQALGQLVTRGVRLGIGLRQSGEELTQLSRSQLTVRLMEQMFELGFRSYDTDEAELVATGIELGNLWDATGVFPVPLGRLAGLMGTDPSGHEELQGSII